ncbi:hypothetical protein [Hydrogenophaga sp.]|uniref:hypothetical protein n=1 Tax=Hydrogenophaga sp. TaxID=1904254 RepID=UPI00286D8E68|nr:hypothetical protein [Hydrogenophaga sp.]
MKPSFSKLALALVSAAVITLSGCGGGSSPSSSGGDPPVEAASFTGTAAAGLPLVGRVTVKDATGATKEVTIGDNGSYTVDVTGMTAPFMFRAEGTAGGTTYVLHSGATAADVNGNINITPLTDLVIANVAGQLAANYFDGGNFSSLTPDEVQAEKDALRDKLLPVLQAMGVEGTIDLMRTQFTPLSSALDKALDVISVSVDPDTSIATITNLINDQQIQDALQTKAAQETAVSLPGTGMTTAADDITAVRLALTGLASAFADGLPSAGAIEAQLHGGTGSPNVGDATQLPFRSGDKNAAQWATMIAGDSALVGMRITDVTIHKFDYTSIDNLANLFPRAFVGFTLRDKNGIVMDRVKSVQMAKGSDGVWRLRGDGRRMDIGGYAHMSKFIHNNQSACFGTGIEFEISDFNANNNGGTISYVVVKGAGLPSEGLRYEPTDGGNWGITNVSNQLGNRWYIMASSCFGGAGGAGMSDAAIAAIPDQAQYTITAFRADDSTAMAGSPTSAISYKETIPLRPLTLTEAQAASFPVISAPTLANFSTFNGGDLTISGSNTNPNVHLWMYSSISNGAELNEVDEGFAPTSSGTYSKTFSLGSLSNPVNRREIRVESFANIFRPLMTNIVLDAF